MKHLYFTAAICALSLIFGCGQFDPFDPLPEASSSPAEENGKGGILIIITWPSADVTLPSVEGSLLPGEGSAINLALEVFENTATYTNSNLDTGNYGLTLTLKDDSTTVWEELLLITIYRDQISEHSYSLQSGDLQ